MHETYEEDIEVKEKHEDDEIIKLILEFKDEADSAKKTRKKLDKRNWDMYNGVQDFSFKKDNQSKQVIPETMMGVEVVTNFIQRALIGYGEYFTIDMFENPTLTSNTAREILKRHLDKIDFVGSVADGIKNALLSSLMIFKVYSRYQDNEFNLKIDVLDAHSYSPDPTGRWLYEIHTVTRDLHDIKAMVKNKDNENGIYEKSVVDKIQADFVEQEEEDERNDKRNQDKEETPVFRKRVVLDEFFGTVLNREGEVIKKKAIAVVANGKYLIRKPEDNPFMHGKSPFVAEPILRIPGSVWHKALYDPVVELNMLVNEIANLIIDGGVNAAQNIKTIRYDALLKPEQAENGIDAGATIVVKGDFPVGAKVLEAVKSGEVPADSMAVLQWLTGKLEAVALKNEFSVGQLPDKQVKATEIIEKRQGMNKLLEGFVNSIEKAIKKTLELSWSVIMQNRDDYLEFSDILNENQIMVLNAMSSEERYRTFAKNPKFKVDGITGLIVKQQNFQKLMIAMDTVFKNPILAEIFARKYSPDKIIRKIFEGIDLNPKDIELEKDEEGVKPEMIESLFSPKVGENGAGKAPFRNPFPAERFPSGMQEAV